MIGWLTTLCQHANEDVEKMIDLLTDWLISLLISDTVCQHANEVVVKMIDLLTDWLISLLISALCQHANEDVEKMILGNKCDMEDKRQVSRERGEVVSACLVSLFVHILCFLLH